MIRRERERERGGTVKERSANEEGVSKPYWYGNEGFNYGWIHYQIKAEDLYQVCVVFGDWYQETPQTPVTFYFRLLAGNESPAWSFTPLSQSEIDL